MRTLFILLFIPFCSFSSEIEWQQLTNETFVKAKQENKIVLLNLEANWCHWCHVMHDSTYSNPEVIAYINAHFIPVKADQDANPELSNRYKEYGWPATIFLNANGEDVVKRAGYISPMAFLRLLKAIVADPSPEEEMANFSTIEISTSENPELTKQLQENYIQSLDFKVGGFDQSQKYVQWATFEYAVFESRDAQVKNWVEKSVNGAKQLSDPEWGGVYQYSTDNDWEHLHFEKLLSIQARYTSIFLLNYFYSNDPSSLDFAKKTIEYADRFLLQPIGLYANAQDADLVQGEHAGAYFALNNEERLKLGIPKVDTNTFTDNNAAVAIALTRLYFATNERQFLEKALRVDELLSQRKMKNGLYSHASKSTEIASLRDQIALFEWKIELAKLDFNNAQNNQDLKELSSAIIAEFKNDNGSFRSFSGSNGLQPQPLIEENIHWARMLNWYAEYSKNSDYKAIAKGIYQFLISDEVAEMYYSEPALLLLEKELGSEPNQYVYLQSENGTTFNGTLHVVVPFYSLIFDAEMDKFPKDKQELLKSFDENTLFMCTSNYCSSPMKSNEELMHLLKK